MALVNLLGETVQGKNGPVDVASLSADNDVVAFYFSAHWCPPCRAFTPVLAEYHKTVRARGIKFDVVFVSSDKSEEESADYYNGMPWLIVPYVDRERKTQLAQKYEVKFIPTLIVLNAKTGEVISSNGVEEVKADSNGDNFAWK
jgi:nucleoredoxin